MRPAASTPVACRCPSGSGQIQTSSQAGGIASSRIRASVSSSSIRSPSASRSTPAMALAADALLTAVGARRRPRCAVRSCAEVGYFFGLRVGSILRVVELILLSPLRSSRLPWRRSPASSVMSPAACWPCRDLVEYSHFNSLGWFPFETQLPGGGPRNGAVDHGPTVTRRSQVWRDASGGTSVPNKFDQRSNLTIVGILIVIILILLVVYWSEGFTLGSSELDADGRPRRSNRSRPGPLPDDPARATGGASLLGHLADLAIGEPAAASSPPSAYSP